jgi:CRISPR type IV-associated protein Csf1
MFTPFTPTQLIRQAALSSGNIPLAKGKNVTYKDVETVAVKDKLCWLCGGETGGRGVPTKKAIKPTFTDIPLAKVLDSKSICPGCAFCLSYRELRNYSIVATENSLSHPSRAELREILLNPPEPPFVICIAVSGQKWVHIRSRVAYTRDYYPVQMEETAILVNTGLLDENLAVIERLYTVFSKDEIRTGNYNPIRICKFGIAEFEELEEKVKQWRGTRLFELALFVARKEESK